MTEFLKMLFGFDTTAGSKELRRGRHRLAEKTVWETRMDKQQREKPVRKSVV